MTRCIMTLTPPAFSMVSTSAPADLTLKAMMSAPTAEASFTSKAETGPTPMLTTLTPTASMASARTASLTASAEPCSRQEALLRMCRRNLISVLLIYCLGNMMRNAHTLSTWSTSSCEAKGQ